MTIILVLGLFAGFYMLSLVLRLAVHALPLYVGLAFGFGLNAHGHSTVMTIGAGLLAGVATSVIGQTLFAFVRSPMLRLGIALVFVAPAGFAGYQAVHGLAGLALGSGAAVTLLSLIGAGVIAGMAWTQLGALDRAGPIATGQLQSGNGSGSRSTGWAASASVSRIVAAIVSAARSRICSSGMVRPTRAQPGAAKMAAAIDSCVM